MANNRRRAGGFGFSASLTGPGGIFTIAFISLAIGFAVLLTRGITPSSTLTEPENGDVPVELIQETPIPGQKGLQLKTLKFKECAGVSAVSMQLDITGSMGPFIGDLRNAVLEFTKTMTEDSVIGIQTYNSFFPRVELIPISYYSDIKNDIQPKLASIDPDGGTPSYDALIFSGEVLREAIPKFPDRKFSFIFFSDGEPNVGYSTPADIGRAAQTIKDQGVTVYAIGLGFVRPAVINAVASSPDKAIIAANSSELERVYKEIAQKICSSAK